MEINEFKIEPAVSNEEYQKLVKENAELRGQVEELLIAAETAVQILTNPITLDHQRVAAVKLLDALIANS